MDRRDFVKKLGTSLAAVPIIGALVGKPTLAENNVVEEAVVPEVAKGTGVVKGFRFLDSIDFSKRVRYWESQPINSLTFISRTATVQYSLEDENKILEGVTGQYHAADLISDTPEAVVYDTVGVFDSAITHIPNLKMGSKVSEHVLAKLAQASRENNSPDTVKFFKEWENAIAQQVVTGIKQRQNALCVSFMLGGVDNKLGHVVSLNLGVPQGLHSSVQTTDFTNRPLYYIRKHLRTVKKQNGVTYDRMTLSTKAFFNIVSTTENKKLVKAVESKDANRMRRTLSKLLNVDVDIEDSVYYERSNKGTRVTSRYLPENKILFSNKNNDNNPDVFHFASAIVSESIVSHLVGNDVTDGIQHGMIGYYTGNRDLNPPDIRAWGVMRGLPVLKDKTAFSSLTINI